jgi:aminomuconate-semialdehyde/2-hydroxymuconate-6-semialdehyde dehydrogenase
MTLTRPAAADAPPSRRPAFIDGAYVAAPSAPVFDNINPADGSLISQIEAADRDLVDRAVQAARKASRGAWRGLSADKRAEVMRRIAAGIEARFDEFLAAEMRDTGKPIALASHLDIPRGAANFRAFADVMLHASESFTMTTPDGGQAINYAIRAPLGVIAVVCPWNLPLLLMTWKVAPALACGNTVIVKPSEETPSTALLLGEVMRDAGVPDGVYNVVNGFGADAAGEFLTSHPDVDGVTFTGETGTGEAIMRAAARGVRPVSFELGGKNAGLIFADCDIEAAIETTARAVFANAGQVCLQTERLYVQRPIFDQFVAGLKARAEALKPGDPWAKSTTLGPLISQEHRRKVLSYYEAARRDGAEVITGGGIPDVGEPLAGGSWIQPTLWTGLGDTASVVTEEIFGPCAHIRPFDDEEEAVTLANDSPFGLASMTWTRDVSRAHRVAGQLEAGTNWVNAWFLRDLRAPFGGTKRSGIGREGGVHSLEFYTELRNVCIKL